MRRRDGERKAFPRVPRYLKLAISGRVRELLRMQQGEGAPGVEKSAVYFLYNEKYGRAIPTEGDAAVYDRFMRAASGERSMEGLLKEFDAGENKVVRRIIKQLYGTGFFG